MKIGVGLPTTTTHSTAAHVRAWAEAIDQGPFSSVCAIERICHPTWDPLIALAGVALVTRRVRLMTTLLLGPARPTGLLVQSIASLDRLAGGRLAVGLGVGGRAADYEAADAEFGSRGRRFDAQLETLHRLWRQGSSKPGTDNPRPDSKPAGDPPTVGPAPLQPNGPELLVGGSAPPALARAGRLGDGYLAGSAGPQVARQAYDAVVRAWEQAERVGSPRFVGLVWFALDTQTSPQSPSDAQAVAQAYLRDYFAELGPSQAQARATQAQCVTSATQVQEAIEAHAAVGMDELIFLPCAKSVAQVDLLAESVIGLGLQDRL